MVTPTQFGSSTGETDVPVWVWLSLHDRRTDLRVVWMLSQTRDTNHMRW